jgi:hypothetical protein
MAHPGLAYRLLAHDSKVCSENPQGRTSMAQILRKRDEPNSSTKAKGVERATKIFSLVMLAVCAVILLMIIIMDW